MYTLEQLAHFDRCLYPGDFKDDLIRVGVDVLDASAVMYFMKRKSREGISVGIVQIYQEYISDKELTNAFDKVVSEFVSK